MSLWQRALIVLALVLSAVLADYVMRRNPEIHLPLPWKSKVGWIETGDGREVYCIFLSSPAGGVSCDWAGAKPLPKNVKPIGRDRTQ